MAIIKTYPLKTSYFSQDRLVLSDMQPDSEGIVKGETKSLTLASLKNFIGSQVLDVSASTTDRYKGVFVSPSIGNVKVGIDLLPLTMLLAPNGFDYLLVTDDPSGNPINKKTTVDNFFSSAGLITNSSINYTVKLPNTVGGASQVLQLPSVIGSSPHQLEWSTPAGSGTVIGTGTTNYIPKWNSSSELTDSIVYENGANIGIGTTNPASKLEVINTIGVSGLRPIRINAGTGAVDIRGSGAGGWANAYNFNGSLNTVLGGFGCLGLGDGMNYFYIGSAYNNTTMVIKPNNGNVGIGTTTPSQKLTVSGKGLFVTGGSTPDSTTATYEKGITLTSGGAGNQRLVIDVSDVTNGGSYIQTRHQSTGFPTAEYALALNPLGGNVGIGTSTPDAKLEVIGNYKQKASDSNIGGFTISINSGTDAVDLNNYYNAPLTFSVNNAEKMRINSGGNVGIGTTAPAQKLEVEGKIKITGANDALQLYRNSSTQANYIKFYDNATSLNEAYLGYTSNNKDLKVSNLSSNGTVTFQSGGGGAGGGTVRLSAIGNLGIGTTAPISKLDVRGVLSFPYISTTTGTTVVKFSESNDDEFLLKANLNGTGSSGNSMSFGSGISGWASDIMTWMGDGSVGIGTIAPNAKLHIQNTSGSTSQIRMSAESANANFAFLEMEDVTVNTAKLTLGTTVGYNVQKPALSIFNSYTTLLGDGTSNGRLLFNCSANTHSVEIQGPDHAGGTSYSLKLPNSLPSVSNQVLESNALGVLSWIPTPSGGGGGGGTVTSVGLSAPPAFSVGNSPITGSGSISLGVTGGTVGEFLAYNGQWATPPDTGTIVVGNPGTGASAVLAGISIGSTVYSIPQGTGNGTITSVQAGTGISGGGSSGIVTVTNSDRGSSQLFYKTFTPDNGTNVVASTNQDTMTVKGGSGITTSGAGDQLSISNNLAASLERGGIQIGYTQNGKNYPVLLSGEKAYVNVPWTSGGGGIGFSGSTADGLTTYSNSTTAAVSSDVRLRNNFMTFDGSTQGTGVDFYSSGSTSILRFGDMEGDSAATVELWTDGARKFEVGANGEIGLGTNASQGTSGQVLTSGGTGAAPTWSSGGTQNFANANLTQTGNRTYAMAQYAITFTGTSTISMQNSNGLVVSGNIISNSQSYAAKNSISNKNTSFTVDFNDGNVQQVNLTNGSGNVIISFSNVRAGARYTIITTRLGYEGTYGTYSFNSVLWPNNSTPQNVPAGSGTFNMYEFVATTTSSSGMLGYFFRNYQTAS